MASGERGLSAFLPDPSASHIPIRTAAPEWSGAGPILPLTNDWRDTDFSLDAIVNAGRSDRSVGLRDFCLTLLSKYVYSIGETPAVFAPVASARQLTTRLRQVDDSTAMVCINDDLPDGDEVGSEVFKLVLDRWMDSRWSTPGGWER